MEMDNDMMMQHHQELYRLHSCLAHHHYEISQIQMQIAHLNRQMWEMMQMQEDGENHRNMTYKR